MSFTQRQDSPGCGHPSCSCHRYGRQRRGASHKESHSNNSDRFDTGDDPIAIGLVLGLNKPSGNVTGVSAMAGELPAKRMELLHELVPAATVVGVIPNPRNTNAKLDEATLKIAAGVIGLQLHMLTAENANSLNAAFATAGQNQIGTLIINTDASLLSRRDQIIALAARHKIPTMYSYREWASDGGY